MIATASAPTHPNRLIEPNEAKLAGSKYMPEPIMFPATNAVANPRPSEDFSLPSAKIGPSKNAARHPAGQ